MTDPYLIKKLAVEEGVDPRTVQKVQRGEHVRGLAGYRARRVLEQAGVLPRPQVHGGQR